MAMTSNGKRMPLAAAIALSLITFILLMPAMATSGLAIVNIIIMFCLAWYGWIHHPDQDTKPTLRRQSPLPRYVMRVTNTSPEPSDDHDDPFSEVDRDIIRASRLADSDDAITALHRFRRTLTALSDEDYSDDIADDLNIIVEHNFPDLINRYISAKQRSSGPQNSEADHILTSSVQRLNTRILEIASQQAHAKADSLREHSEYLRMRHPVESDPFSSIGNLTQ